MDGEFQEVYKQVLKTVEIAHTKNKRKRDKQNVKLDQMRKEGEEIESKIQRIEEEK